MYNDLIRKDKAVRRKIFTKENWKKVPHIGATLWIAIDAAKAAMREFDDKEEEEEKEIKPERWIVVRRKDGKVWRGPWYENGKSFTVVEDRWCVFKSQEDAERMAMDENLPNRWSTVDIS
jgi:hypothetical protein